MTGRVPPGLVARLSKESANLDLLRALAVLFVFLAHLNTFLGDRNPWVFHVRSLGTMGVLLFFVHTCFVLMLSLERQEKKYGTRWRFPIFMLRRVFRIYPLCMLVVSVIILFHIPAAKLDPWHFTYREKSVGGYLANLLLVQDLTNSGSVLGPLWSLPFELQMYVFLPALFLAVRKPRPLWLLLLVWALTVPIALAEDTVPGIPGLMAFLPCFLPGVIAYALSRRVEPRWPSWGWVLLLAACAPIVTAFQHPLVGMFVCLGVGLNLVRFAEIQNPWLRRAAHLVAKYSYGIYLTHYFAIQLAFIVFDGYSRALQWFVLLASAALMPVLLYHSVEEPFIKLGNRLTDWLFTGGDAVRVPPAWPEAPVLGSPGAPDQGATPQG